MAGLESKQEDDASSFDAKELDDTRSTDSTTSLGANAAIYDILIATLWITLPMVLLSAVFFAFVFHYRIPMLPSHDIFRISAEPVDGLEGIQGAYYIGMDSTQLITVASWTSTIAGLLPTFVMVLLSYRLAGTFKALSHDGNDNELPTPFQLRLLVHLCTGSVEALWSWVRSVCRPGRRAKNVLLTWAITGLFFSYLLAFAIFAVDTWLHVSTTTVQISRTLPLSSAHFPLSRDLRPACKGNKKTGLNDYCTFHGAKGDFISGRVLRYSAAQMTLFNVSAADQVLPLMHNGTAHAILAPPLAERTESRAFRASTYAVGTKCTPISRFCDLHSCCGHGLLQSIAYNCSLHLSQYLIQAYDPWKVSNGTEPGPHKITNNSWASFIGIGLGTGIAVNTGSGPPFFLEYFKGEDLLRPYNPNDEVVREWVPRSTYFTQYRPSVFVVGAVLPVSDELKKDPETVLYHPDDSSAFMLKCSSEVLEIDYTFVGGPAGGTVRDPSTRPASKAAIAAITRPWAFSGPIHPDFLTSGLRAAALLNTSQQLADAFALSYSHVVLSLGVGAVEQAPALAASERIVSQATRLPKRPFYTLIALNLVYAALGAGLAVLALAGKPSTVKGVQSRMSTTGLIATLFESLGTKIDELGNGHDVLAADDRADGGGSKVAIVPSKLGGWTYVLREKHGRVVEDGT